ncbi:alpha/beta hydrolase [Iodidimonas nitroreducens]|uniref:Alpha/beta hydrolase n=1 Tax=Iodidimonas nitroreducens TaxID=1236968 RepID=A0A5A7N9T3_9PROT|nr:alpha/beta hydrolase [Iodidimonas nitroreducens]GAK34143.1 arylesterase [alpha proteobacterium Q-1]GER05131.1 alpha/beta hydrolase [Iodidimonas nitroreducens]
MTDITVSGNGTNIPVSHAGHGPALLLLHGWTLDRRMWAPQLAELAKDFMVIAIDRRGFGDHDAAPDLAADLADIDRVLDHFDLPQASLIGMSQGGRLALSYAAQSPKRLRSMILHGAPLEGFLPLAKGDEQIPLDTYRRWARAGRMDDVRSAWRTHRLMQVPHDQPEVQALVDSILAGYRGLDLLHDPAPTPSTPGLKKIGEASTDQSMAARLSQIDVPTLALVGAQDTRWLDLVASALAYGLPFGQKAVVAGGGHLVNLTHPDAYHAAIRGFLA